jgi:hypothetical protein
MDKSNGISSQGGDISPDALLAIHDRMEEARQRQSAMSVTRPSLIDKLGDDPCRKQPTSRSVSIPRQAWRRKRTVLLSEDGSVSYRGDTYEVDFEARQGMDGMPWNRGRLRLEHHNALQPFQARGLGSDPGVYWRMRSMPHVTSALMDYISALAGVPWRVERADLPEWVLRDPKKVEAADRQFRFCERLWSEWHAADADRCFSEWVMELLQYSLICGFCLHEIVADRKSWDLDGTSKEYLVPRLELRAPWTVQEWLLSEDRPVGVVQQLSNVVDMDGKTGPYQVVIPWDKLLHFSVLSGGGSDLEGFSLFVRPAYNPLQMLQEILQLQSLAAEVNGVGTIEVYKHDPNVPDMSKDDRSILEEHLLSFRAGHVPWLIPPPGYRLEFHSPQNLVPDFSPQVQMLERIAMLAVGQSHKMIGLFQHGSFAARDSAEDSARLLYEYPARRVSKLFERLFHRAIAMNFPADAAMGNIFPPAVRYSQVRQRDNKAHAETLREYVDAGLLTQTYGDESVVRKALDMPALTEVEWNARRAAPAADPNQVTYT